MIILTFLMEGIFLCNKPAKKKEGKAIPVTGCGGP
jgi:hypothetical protein